MHAQTQVYMLVFCVPGKGHSEGVYAVQFIKVATIKTEKDYSLDLNLFYYIIVRLNLICFNSEEKQEVMCFWWEGGDMNNLYKFRTENII